MATGHILVTSVKKKIINIFHLNFRDLGSELRNSLTCVLDSSTASSKALDRCIDALVDGINRRLDLTQEAIDIMSQLDLVNEKLNYV